MHEYLCCQKVRAEPMRLLMFLQLQFPEYEYAPVAVFQNPHGYLVEFDTGARTWMPREDFERNHIRTWEDVCT